MHFVCVGTPQAKDSPAADMTYVDQVITAWPNTCTRRCLVVGKSTVPVGTRGPADPVAAVHRTWSGTQVELAWNPEFLREGFAVEDTLRPDRLVFGVASDVGPWSSWRRPSLRCSRPAYRSW